MQQKGAAQGHTPKECANFVDFTRQWASDKQDEKIARAYRHMAALNDSLCRRLVDKTYWVEKLQPYLPTGKYYSP